MNDEIEVKYHRDLLDAVTMLTEMALRLSARSTDMLVKKLYVQIQKHLKIVKEHSLQITQELEAIS